MVSVPGLTYKPFKRKERGGKGKEKGNGERGKDHDNRKYYNFLISASQAL